MCDVHESADDRSHVRRYRPWGGLNVTHSIFKVAGLGALSLRFLKAIQATFQEVENDGWAQQCGWPLSGVSFVGRTHCFAQPSFAASQFKRRHWLLAPQEIGQESMEKWLAHAPADWGSAGQGDYIDSTVACTGWMAGGDCAETFESLGRYSEAIEAAKV